MQKEFNDILYPRLKLIPVIGKSYLLGDLFSQYELSSSEYDRRHQVQDGKVTKSVCHHTIWEQGAKRIPLAASFASNVNHILW